MSRSKGDAVHGSIAVVLSERLQLDCHFLDEQLEPSGGAQLLYFGLT